MKRRGYAIPLCILVAAVALMLAVSALALSQQDVNLAQATIWNERALQVAHYGLECGVARGGFAKDDSRDNVYQATYSWRVADSLTEDEVEVTAYDNSAATPLAADSGCPVSVPRGYLYWVAEGKAVDSGTTRSKRRVGALLQMGIPLGSGGAQVSYLNRRNSTDSAPSTQDWSFQITDPDGNLATDQVLFATDQLTAGSLALGKSGSVEGKIRIPTGASDDTATSVNQQLQIVRDGGAFNVSPYNPPPLAEQGDRTVNSVGETVPPGNYANLTLHEAAQLQSGTYHIGLLHLKNDDHSELRGPSDGSVVKLLVDDVIGEDPATGGRLALFSHTTAAKAFKLTLGPVAGGSAGDDVLSGGPPSGNSGGGSQNQGAVMEGSSFELRTNGGPVQVVAPGRRIKALAGALSNAVQGSFMCKQLTLMDSNSTQPARFLGDTSANSARRDDSNSGSMNFQRTGNKGGPHLRAAGTAPFGTEPFILSRSVF